MKALKQQMASTPGSPSFRPDSFKNRFTPTAKPILRSNKLDEMPTTPKRESGDNGEKLSHLEKVNLIRSRKPIVSTSTSSTPSPRPESSHKSGYLSSMFSSTRNENGQDKAEKDADDKKVKPRKPPSPVDGPPKSPVKTAHPRVPRKSSTEEDPAGSRTQAGHSSRSSPRKSSAVR